LGIDSDNGSEFINRSLLSWADSRRITFTRTRPYKKNDNCFVEQKNLKCVREYVGYRRFDTPAELQALAAVYRSRCPLLNYFLPTVKLIDKTRVGAKVRKVYDQPRNPYQRLLTSLMRPRRNWSGGIKATTRSCSNRRFTGRLMR
jgi:hypothetical protein